MNNNLGSSGRCCGPFSNVVVRWEGVYLNSVAQKSSWPTSSMLVTAMQYQLAGLIFSTDLPTGIPIISTSPEPGKGLLIMSR